MTKTKERAVVALKIKRLKLQAIRFLLRGKTPLVQRPILLRRDPDKDFHRSAAGWYGIPASGVVQSLRGAGKFLKFRGVSRLHLEVVPDGVDVDSSTGLVKITKGARKDHESGTGKVYDAGWEAVALVRFDDLKPEKVVELMLTAGAEIGVGAYRPDAHRYTRSKKDPNYDHGTFSVEVL